MVKIFKLVRRAPFTGVILLALSIWGCAAQVDRTAPVHDLTPPPHTTSDAKPTANTPPADATPAPKVTAARRASEPTSDVTDNDPEPPATVVVERPVVDNENIPFQVLGTPEPVLTDTLDENSDAEPVIAANPNVPVSRTDIWERIRKGFKLNHSMKGVAGDIAWFQRKQDYLDRVVDRAEPYLHMIVEEVERRGIPLEIALLPVVESAFQPFAYSNGRAAGIWQFIPGTGRLYGLKQNWWYDGRRDVYEATNAALTYLQLLHDSFNGDWELALAAYNSGEGTVQRSLDRNLRARKPIDFSNLKLPRETRGYVPSLHAIASIVADPAKYGITLRSIPNAPYLTRVPIDGQIDLAFAADLAEISVEEMYRLNPAFNRWATDPDGPHFLLLPRGVVDVFKQRLAQFPLAQRTRWEEHRVAQGETLISIARAYNTSPEVLEKVNRIKGGKIRPGRDLVIPVAMQSLNASSAPTEPSPVTEEAPAPPAPKPVKRIYSVKPGDTLYAIARRTKFDVKDIAEWNAMDLNTPLRVGQKLTLWDQPPAVEPAADTAPKAAALSIASLGGPPQSEILRSINYVIRRGDTLPRIADRFKVSLSDIYSWNALPKNKRIRVGQRIVLHVDVTQQ